MADLIYRYQIEHVFNQALWNIPQIKAYLEGKGFYRDMVANKLSEFSDTDTVERIQNLSDDNPFKQALLDEKSGFGIVRHDGGAPGGNQLGKLRFLTDEIDAIRGSGASDNAQEAAQESV